MKRWKSVTSFLNARGAPPPRAAARSHARSPQPRALAVCFFLSLIGVAQAPDRRATHVDALVAYPNFFHGRAIIVRARLEHGDKSVRLKSGEEPTRVRLVVRSGVPDRDALFEIRGTFWDVGRLADDESRLATVPELRALVADGEKPRAGELLAVVTDGVQEASPPPAPGLRAVALEPQRYADQRVTIAGQFRGRNLYGDLPQAPGVSKWDYVLRSADAAVWVTGLRPRGRGFDLDVSARVDTGRWLEVSGLVRSGKGQVWIDAEKGQVALATAPAEATPAEVEPPTVGPRPEVIFSAPTEGETDVSLTAPLRIQFSRDMKADTIKGQVRVAYSASDSIERGEPQPPALEFTTSYEPGRRVLEIRFTQPLARFRPMKVELLDGIAAHDGAPLKPWTLTFMTGGS